MIDAKRERSVQYLLEWYFCYSISDMGITSNFGPIIVAGCFGDSNAYYDPMHEGILHAVSQRREIEKNLFKLSQLDQKVLYACFGDTPPYPEDTNKLLQHYAGAAFCLQEYKPIMVNRICSKIVSGKADLKDQAAMSQIRAQAMKLYNNALNNYIVLENNNNE